MSVKVAVRVRPFNQRQINLHSQCCVEMQDGKTRLLSQFSHEDFSKKEFTFDYSFWSHSEYQTTEDGKMIPMTDKFWGQERVFKEVGMEVINNSWQGYNCCLFAYGQTGSGKSYSMIGFGANKGIVPQACEEIFKRIDSSQEKNKTFEVTVSMVEIYNEKVQDLFIPDSKQRPPGGLQIRENKKLGVYVQGVTKHTVRSFKEIEKWMDQGSKNRSLASTLMNQYSSRAHTIISMEFIQRQQVSKSQVTQKSSTIHLIDLAGSERVGKTGLANSDRLKEAGNINKSLHHLGLVIEILAEKSMGKRKNEVVPYRSSCLTRILQNSLGGNSKTIMICAISPSNDNYQESLSTLRYADQVKKIKNNATVNESLTDKIIRELRQENQRLKSMIKDLNDKTTISPTQQNLLEDVIDEQREVQRKISRNSKAMKNFDINDFNPLEQTLLTSISDVDNLDETDHDISQFIDMDMFKNNEPFLTNLNEDQLLTGKLQYNIEEELLVGRKNGNPTPKVVLGALGIEPNHAKIYRRMDHIFISTYSEAAGEFTYVNGQNVYQSIEIFHNDRIVFGTSCVFLLKTPEGIPRKQIPETQLTYEFAISQLQSIDKNKSTVEDEEFITKLKQIEQDIQAEKARMHSKILEEKKRFEEEIAKVKAQQQKQNLHLQEKLRKKDEEAVKLAKEKIQMQEIRQASRKLQQELEKQRIQKLELQKCLEESMEIEHELREEKQRQLKTMELKQQRRLEELRRQQQILEAQQKLRQQEQERLDKIRQQEELERVREQSRIRAEEDIQRHQMILKIKTISCQNENILNERFLELKKKKKEVQQLRNLLVKKERVQLQKKLVDLLPQIIELNLIAKEMQRQFQFVAKIDYQYFGYYELAECLKNSSYKGRIQLRVMVENLEEGRIYFWTIQTFKNRLYLAKDMLEIYIQNPTNPILFDKDNDPFWDPKEYELLGQAYVTFEHLLFNLDYVNPSLKIINDRNVKGQMSIRIYPTTAEGSQNLAREQQKICQIHNPRSIFQKDLHFIIAIDSVKIDMEELVEYYVQYEILENNYRFVKYQTNKINRPQTNYFRKHLFKEVTEPTLLYIGGSQLTFKLYGLRQSHKIVLRESVKADYEPSQSDIEQMNSFINHTKSQAQSFKTPPKSQPQSKGVIYENPDLRFSLQKPEQNIAVDKGRHRNADFEETMSIRSSKTSKTSKDTSKDMSKSEKDKCILF